VQKASEKIYMDIIFNMRFLQRAALGADNIPTDYFNNSFLFLTLYLKSSLDWDNFSLKN